MSFNVEEFINRFKDRANAVKDRPMPPIGGDERMQFMKQAELDYQDYMIISDSEFEITDKYFIYNLSTRLGNFHMFFLCTVSFSKLNVVNPTS